MSDSDREELQEEDVDIYTHLGIEKSSDQKVLTFLL